ncbi:hypothetical protein MAM1_0051d03366 [Mucor ambiguus]|uniref:Uncharacterized protein n=1 Tax=Mucor ambiguus TaxID=91626 RepID=A0A0C9LTP5_9FUNG|nr:hypothetical protein MAM1_0051d03366 [Mucor ambiguus]
MKLPNMTDPRGHSSLKKEPELKEPSDQANGKYFHTFLPITKDIRRHISTTDEACAFTFNIIGSCLT